MLAPELHGDPVRWRIVALIALALAGLVYLVVVAVRWRRQRATAPAPRSTALPRQALVRVWRRFLRAQPWRYRFSIVDQPVVVVLGPAAAGKSALIAAQVDWVAQKKRFFPSVTDDPLLQIYCGTRLIAQELAPALLADDSAAARRALARLWRKSARRAPPSLLIVLDGATLAETAPDELRHHAELVRGKVQLLQEAHGRAVRVSVCLTHMDLVEGFAELAELCSKNKLPLALDLASLAPASADRQVELGERTAPYEDYLPLALTHLGTDGFRRLVEFIGRSAQRTTALGHFLAPLTATSRWSQPPVLGRLHLFSLAAHPQADLAFLRPALAPRRASPTRRHLVRCALIVGAVALLLGAAHAHQATVLKQAETAVARLELAATATDHAPGSGEAVELRGALDAADRALTEVGAAESLWPPLRKTAFARKRGLERRTADAIRFAYLMPPLRRGGPAFRERTLYTLALLYADRSNELGRLVGSRLHHFAANLELPDAAVEVYLRWSARAWTGVVPLPQAVAADGGETMLTEQPWSEFLTDLQTVYDSDDLGTALEPLRERAGALAEILDRDRRFSEVPRLLRILPDEAPVDLDAFLRAPRRHEALAWLERNRAPLERLIAMVRQTAATSPRLGLLNLTALVAHVNKLLEPGAANELITVELGRHFSFATRRWAELVARADVQTYVRQPGYPFLPRDGALGSDGDATRSDVYHHQTVDGSVRPVLDELAHLLPACALPAADKSALDAYVADQMVRYARGYRDALLGTYQQYHVRVSSAVELPLAVTQLVQPSSGFLRLLRATADDADLGKLDGPYLRPLAEALAPLQPIVRLVKPGKDVGQTELGRYTALVMRMSRELQGGDAAAPAELGAAMTPPSSPAAGATQAGGEELGGNEALTRLLSPIGRLALAMLLQPERSYQTQTEHWLDELGITGDLRQPFLEPFNAVLDYGVPEIEHVLLAQWTQEWAPVSSLLTRYPFAHQATKDVEPAELDTLREHDGGFWSTWRALFGALCVVRGGSWVPRANLLRRVTLPAGMLARVNLVARISRVFYDKDGKRAPLPLAVKPLPLPKELTLVDGYATTSFLRVGDASIIGFNQQPAFQPFLPAWWQGDGASVGLQFGRPGLRGRPDRLLETSSAWAFHHLLDRARIVDEVATWTLPAGGLDARALPIQFALRGNPVALRPWTLLAPAAHHRDRRHGGNSGVDELAAWKP